MSSSDVITKNTLMSYFARVNYNYKGRYMLSAAFRRDGSSRFAPNNKWGNFPSISLGWLVTEEDFMKKMDWINMLKLRVSYGLTGNDHFQDYVWVAKLNQSKTAFGNNKLPTWEDFMNFLEERCIPKERSGIREYLEAIGVAEYNPLEIIKKTKGKMAEDKQWIEIEEI